MTIGNKIRLFRDLRGYTQAELGQKVGLPGDRIRQYENDVRTPKADMLKAIADALDVDVKEIILNKMEKTAKKYPIEKAKGISTKYDKL